MKHTEQFVWTFLVLVVVFLFSVSHVNATMIVSGNTTPSQYMIDIDSYNTIWVRDGSLGLNASSDGNGITTTTVSYMNIGDGEGTIGSVTVTGDGTSGSAQITTTGEFAIYLEGETGTLTIENGGIVEANEGNIYLGVQGLSDTATTATTTIDGSGSILRAQQDSEGSTWSREGGSIVVGFAGQSTSVVNITNGGTMEALSGGVGDTWDSGRIEIGQSADSGSTAIVNVDGEGSAVKADNYIYVGASESNVTAQLNITNGADVEVTDGYAASGDAASSDMHVSAFAVDSEASVTVNGSGSTLTVDELQIGGKTIIVGYTKDGTPVANTQFYSDDTAVEGTKVTDQDGNPLYDSDGNPVLYVNYEIMPGYYSLGPSTLTAGNYIYVKDTGSVVVENGALLDTKTIDISENNSSATAYNEQYATLTVRDGGIVNGDINVYEDGILNGDGTIVGNVTVEGGTVAPGNSPGKLTIGGDLIIKKGTLEIEVESSESYDSFDVSGNIQIYEDAIIEIILSDSDIDSIDITDFFTGYDSLIFDEDFDPLTGIVLSVLGLADGETYSIDLNFFEEIYTYKGEGSTAPVPVPSTILLFCTGLAGIAGIKRKMK